MPDIELFATDEEIFEIIKFLVGRECVFVGDRRRESVEYEQSCDVGSIQKLAEESPHMFVISEEWSESPLSVREVISSGSKLYYINPRCGGPSMQFYWGRRFKKEERDHLSATWFSYYPWYQSSVLNERMNQPLQLKAKYAQLLRIIRQGRRKIRPGKRLYWIGPQVERLVQNGLILVGLEGYPMEQILGKPGQPDLAI